MIAWLVTIFVAVFVGVIIWKLDEYRDGWYVVSVIIWILCVIMFFTVLIASQEQMLNIANFKGQSQYLSSHVPTNEFEDVALTQEKIELNKWLFRSQKAKNTYGIFSVYSDEILELDPID